MQVVPAGIVTGRDGKETSPTVKRTSFLIRKILQPLVIIYEYKTAVAKTPVGPAELRIIALRNILRRRERSLHRSQGFTPVVHEEVELAQRIIMWISLSELPERSLEIVILHRHVVVVGGLCALILV